MGGWERTYGIRGWGTVGGGGYLGLEILARKQIANRLGHSLPRHLSKRTSPPDFGAFPKTGSTHGRRKAGKGVSNTPRNLPSPYPTKNPKLKSENRVGAQCPK